MCCNGLNQNQPFAFTDMPSLLPFLKTNAYWECQCFLICCFIFEERPPVLSVMPVVSMSIKNTSGNLPHSLHTGLCHGCKVQYRQQSNQNTKGCGCLFFFSFKALLLRYLPLLCVFPLTLAHFLVHVFMPVIWQRTFRVDLLSADNMVASPGDKGLCQRASLLFLSHPSVITSCPNDWSGWLKGEKTCRQKTDRNPSGPSHYH